MLTTIGPESPCTMIFCSGTSMGQPGTDAAKQAAMQPMWGGEFASYPWVWAQYPASMWPVTGTNSPTMGVSIAAGIADLLYLIRTIPGKKCIVSFSQGSILADEVLHVLAEDPGAPPADELTYLLCCDPCRPGGLFAHYFPVGYHIPILDYTMRELPNTQYSGSVLVWEYDGAGDWPDTIGPYPEGLLSNPLAVANAVMGFIGIHCGVSQMVGWPGGGGLPAAGAAPLNRTTCSNGGVVDTHLIPTWPLPVLYPLPRLLYNAGTLLQPLIEASYNRITRDYGNVEGNRYPRKGPTNA